MRRAPECLRINGVVADFAAETMRDAAGRSVELRPQSFAVLGHLAANPGRLVTKDELMAAVWPGIAVTDDSLVQCVHEIRRAIGDEARAVLRTVPRRGYRLVLPAAPAAARGRRIWPLAAAALALALAVAAGAWLLGSPDRRAARLDGPPVVALVPFLNLTGDPVSARLALGVRKASFPNLSRVRDFQTVHRSPSFAYGDGRPTGVDLVLGGGIEHAGDRLRITASLLEPASGDLLWSEQWDRPDADPLAVESEVSELIASQARRAQRVDRGAGPDRRTTR